VLCDLCELVCFSTADYMEYGQARLPTLFTTRKRPLRGERLMSSIGDRVPERRCLTIGSTTLQSCRGESQARGTVLVLSRDSYNPVELSIETCMITCFGPCPMPSMPLKVGVVKYPE
jgi:hypothetical protein